MTFLKKFVKFFYYDWFFVFFCCSQLSNFKFSEFLVKFTFKSLKKFKNSSNNLYFSKNSIPTSQYQIHPTQKLFIFFHFHRYYLLMFIESRISRNFHLYQKVHLLTHVCVCELNGQSEGTVGRPRS